MTLWQRLADWFSTRQHQGEPGGGPGGSPPGGGGGGGGSAPGASSSYVSYTYTDRSGVGPFVGPEFQEFLSSSSTGYAASTHLAQSAASVPLRIYRVAGKKRTLLAPDADPVAHLFRYINPREGRTAFFVRTILSLLGAGEVFWLLDKMGGSRVEALWVLRADLMRVVAGPGGLPSGYVYTPKGSRVLYKPEDIFHSMLPNPHHDWRGLPPLYAAQRPAAIQLAQQEQAWRFFRNGAKLGNFFGTEQPMDNTQRQELADSIDRAHRGAEQSHKTIVGSHGLKPHKIQATPEEADYIETMKIAREDQLAVMKVPPAVVGLFEFANYANATQQERFFWQNGVAPLLSMLQEDVNELLLPRLGTGYEAEFALKEVPAVQAMEHERALRYKALVDAGLYTPNEAREGIGKPPVRGGDTLFISFGLTPLGAVAPAETGKAAGEGPGRKQTRYIEDAARNAKRQAILAGYARYEAPLRRGVVAAWDLLESEAMRRLRQEEAKRARGIRDKQVSGDDVLPERDVIAAMRRVLEAHYERTTDGRGQAALAEVGVDELFVRDPEIVRYIERTALQRSKLIAGTAKEELRRVLIEANLEGMTLRQVESAIATLFDRKRFEAARIARTETTSAYNFATFMAWEQSEVVESKEWVAILDDATRESHADLDGERVGMDSFFSNGLMYPGDPGGDAEEIVNCRCALLPTVEAPTRYIVADDLLQKLTARNGKALEVVT